jgi:alpha-N-acetylglucosamine transferase
VREFKKHVCLSISSTTTTTMYIRKSVPLAVPWARRKFPLIALICCILFLLFQYPSPSTPPELTYGRLDHTKNDNPRIAIATFLTENTREDEDDFYFVAARLLTYQILHANETRCRRPIPFLVLVTNTVSTDKQKQLARDGATIVQVEDVPLRWWIKTGVTRWREQFTKLRLFQMVQYDRILFLDSDTLLTRPIDDIFEDPAVRVSDTLFDRNSQIKADEGSLPAQYVFAARSDNALAGERDHPFPPTRTDTFSAGFWMAAPSKEMYQYLLSVMNHYRRFDPHTMEQSLMNYAFRSEGVMPWKELDYKWSATWPNEKDLKGEVATLHEKFWRAGTKDLQDLWWQSKQMMEKYYDELNSR